MKAIMLPSLALLLSVLTTATARPSTTSFSSKLTLRDVSANIDSDPFYTPPVGYESTPQGTVLRNRSIVPDPSLGSGVRGTQLLFRTSGALEEASYAITTVLVPAVVIPGVLLSYQTAEDSTSAKCAPSLTLQGNYTNQAAVSEEPLIAALLAQNLTVAVPDYEGPNSTFSAGRVAAHGVLDGALAALSFLGQTNSTKVVGYAPQLNVVGWSQGGTPANATATFLNVNGGPAAGFAFAGTEGLMAAYPTVRTYIESIATTALSSALDFVRGQCEDNILLAFEYASLFNTTYQPFGDQLLSQSVFAPILQANILGLNSSETPSAPVFVYHAVQDEIIPIAPVEFMYSQYCAAGIKSLQYQRVTGNATHSGTASAFAPLVLQFIARSLTGSVQTGCSVTNISITALSASGNSSSGSIPSSSSTVATGASSTPTGKSAATRDAAKSYAGVALSLLLAAAWLT